MDIEKIMSRLDAGGLILLALGAGLGFFAKVLAGKISPKQADKLEKVLRFAGLGLAILGALILLDVFG